MTTSIYVRFIVCLSLIVVIFARPTTASACSCVGPGLPVQEFQRAKAVFTGGVFRMVDEYVPVFSTLDRISTAIGQHPYFRLQAGRYVGYRVYFDVKNAWKGIEKTTVIIDTGYGMGDCGYPFIVGNDYLVYASYPYGIPNNYWVTSICSGTAEISAATEDLTYLNTLPKIALNPSTQIFGLPIGMAVLLMILFLIAVMIFLYAHTQQVLRSKH